jgi:peptidoglycan hydrolase CwlO-like protein
LSPLTKILIVLLTFATVLLCAFVVSYVASAGSYKDRYQDCNQQFQQAEQHTKEANSDLDKAKAQFAQRERDLNGQITDLRNQLTSATSELSRQKTEVARLLDEANKWTALADGFKQSQDNQSKMLANAQDELEKARADNINLKKQLDEISVSLLQKDAVLKTLQDRVKSLEEEKAGLLARVNEPLRAIGKEVAAPAPVTAPETMMQNLPVTNIDIKALVTAVDMKNSMAAISVGSADGVTKAMRFHVTRGDQFICDILIISVDVNESVGTLELVRQQPMVGDTASTNL